MTITDYILPMPRKRRIIFLAYDGVELLDIAGPAAVFSTAVTLSGDALYSVAVATPQGGLLMHSCGLTMHATSLKSIQIKSTDTVLVVGAYEKALMKGMRDPDLRCALTKASTKAERYGSICTGTFVLGAAGLLDGMKATTHWAGRKRLGSAFKNVRVDSDALYVVDNRLWTSAGVTAGIDMALAMLEEDHGSRLKARVAKQLVIYSHRPGNQSQFSDLLLAQVKVDAQFEGLVDWLQTRMSEPTKVSDMASFLNMTERTFHRQFTEAFNETPSKLFEQLRLSSSRQLIAARDPISLVCTKVGFRSESAFRTAFKNQYGVTPTMYNRVHHS